MILILENSDFVNTESLPFEIVERKGLGHPDTIADILAESISREYSRYCLKEFGVILHHDVDKTIIVGGKTRVEFGGGSIINPIKVYISGRFSTQFSGREVPFKEIIEFTAKSLLSRILHDFDPNQHLNIIVIPNNTSSPGYINGSKEKKGSRKYWFTPRGKIDLPELRFLHANDTSIGVGYAPLTSLERYVLEVENFLNSPLTKQTMPCIGADVKVMGVRYGQTIMLTIALPVISQYVHSIDEYRECLKKVRELVMKKKPRDFDIKISINMRDDYKKPELYLTVTGSSLENGDIGMVGRGNRINGLITPMRPMSIEAPCGKNPVYHVGKIYNVLASRIAKELHVQSKEHIGVYLVSQTGQSLVKPWFIGIYHTGDVSLSMARGVVFDTFDMVDSIREHILSDEVLLCYGEKL